MTKAEPVLLPCPHCKGVAEMDTLWRYRSIRDGQEATGVSIYCLSCDANMMRCYPDYPGEEREDICNALAEVWNTRSDATRIAELEADATRWREVAGELAEAIEAYQNATPRYDWNHGLDAALTAYRAEMESGE